MMDLAMAGVAADSPAAEAAEAEAVEAAEANMRPVATLAAIHIPMVDHPPEVAAVVRTPLGPASGTKQARQIRLPQVRQSPAVGQARRQ
jgi:hypothetical protein